MNGYAALAIILASLFLAIAAGEVSENIGPYLQPTIVCGDS